MARLVADGGHEAIAPLARRRDDSLLATAVAENATRQRRNRAKQTAYDVVQRSQAWSRLIQRVFPRAVRLSIHPQPHHGSKIGFHLIETADNWLTPWHGVVLDDGGRYQLVKRAEAEELGARLVWQNDRPSHFVSG